ncbi:MAG: hypothetical protein ACTSRS_18870 [Candidatus Helarchaeota archaeon]
MSIPNEPNIFLNKLFNYKKEKETSDSLSQESRDLNVNYTYLRGFYDALYLLGYAECIVNQKQFKSYRIILEKVETLLNEERK